MQTIQEYAIALVTDGAQSAIEDDLNKDGMVAEDDHAEATSLALALVRGIKANPIAMLTLVERTLDGWQMRPTAGSGAAPEPEGTGR